ncbi:MAG: acylphosphatase [Dehalococcoidia bacterium]|nr:acylphosphatase [Dehalococcoidia bacterium]
MAKDEGLYAVARGRVQGVSFRYFVLRKAQSLGLKGYVRNLPEGNAVEVVAEGERESLDELLGHINQGPPGAKVQEFDINWAEASGGYDDFRVAYRLPVDSPENNIRWTV